MSDWIIYTAIALTSFALGSLAKGFVANAERKIKEDQEEARRKQHKVFMDVVDTIEDCNIQVEAASIYLTDGPKAAYAFIVEQLQKSKE